jgi:phenylalanyl-tRNA synthetase beta subunit
VWIPSADAKAELEEILSAADLAVKAPRLVDEFEKEGRVSYLYRLVFQAEDRTLTDNEVNAAMDPIYEKIKSHSDWELR